MCKPTNYIRLCHLGLTYTWCFFVISQFFTAHFCFDFQLLLVHQVGRAKMKRANLD